MKEKKVIFKLTEEDLKKLQKKYDCDREVLDLAIDYSLAQFEEHIEFGLHDDVEDAVLDINNK